MKKIMGFILWFVLVICIPGRAFAWGIATHAYFARELCEKFGITYPDEMIYGAMMPDMFNLMFDEDFSGYMHDQTHYEFMKVVDNAGDERLKAFAIGFASHNDSWGADYTAHHNGLTTPGKGYVITKVDLLKPELVSQVKKLLISAEVMEVIAQSLAESTAPMLAELFVESAVDIMIRRNEDPEIGMSMLNSAQLDEFGVSSLLETAYAHDLAEQFDMPVLVANQILFAAEQAFRGLIVQYGVIYTQEESEAIEMLAVMGVAIVESYLDAALDFEVTVPPETKDVFKAFLSDHAIPSVEGDYSAEVAATLEYLEVNLLPVDV
ncbi:MAG TPA: zinc dependent phospholipase C family protein, partial [Anaerolineae bacterium]|nr:zinc dependent phospholipase C family protein [Anaerolineae bacterium]